MLTLYSKRLTDLDLSGNKLTAVRGLDQLPQLCSLNLGMFHLLFDRCSENG